MDVVAIIVFFLTLAGAQDNQLDGPQNTVSVVGSNVTLKCSSPSRSCNGIDWLKYGASGSVFNERGIISSAYRDRYSVDNSSGCDLVIKNVELTDAGRFICRTFISSNTVDGTAYLIIQETQPNCTTTASLNKIAEGDRITLKCEVGYCGTKKASMLWKDANNTTETQPNDSMNSSQSNTVEEKSMRLICAVRNSTTYNVTSLAIENGTDIRRSYYVTAAAPEVPSFACITSFALDEAIIGLATNIPNSTCATSVIKVLYSVRNVALCPSRSHYAPGSVINCTAQGHPAPTFKWQEMEVDGIWTDIENLTGSEFTMTNVSTSQYRCVAMNVVKSKSYNATSLEFFVNNRDSGAEIEGPQNTLSVVGSTAILKCSLPSRSCNETEWLKYTSGRSLMVLDPSGIITKDYRDRYSVDGSSGCDLVIRHVRLTDAGLFICRAYISSNSVEKTAHLIILDTQPKCARNASLNDTVEGDGVHLTCEVTFNGTNRASMVWEGVADAPDAVKTGNTIRRSHLVAAIAPEVPSFTCNTSFVVATRDSTTGAPIMGTATNMPVVTCETPAIKVKFSARNVKLTPASSVYSSGTIITCAAEGYPAPSFKWQTRELENNATWHDIPNAKQRVFAQCFAGLSQFRCIATNVVMGEPQTSMSTVFQIMQSEITGDFTSTAAIRPTSEDHLGVSTGGGTLGGIVCDIGIGIGIGVGIGFLAAILLASIVFVILVRVKMIEFNRRRANKPLDDVVLPMKQESHHLAVANASTRALLVGEQESAYASLGQDRQVNEYASFKERQKTKHDRKSKI